MKQQRVDLRDGSHFYVPIAESYKDCFTLINSDQYRHTSKDTPIATTIFRLLRWPICKRNTLVWLRLCQYRGIFYYFFKLMFNICCLVYRLEISSQTKIGYGFYIGLGVDININHGMIIGNNVNLSHYASFGTNHYTPAIISDNVWIGPMVCLVDNVEIGNSASVGAGAVVVKDIPANSTCAGVPAKVINYNDPGRFVNNRWPLNFKEE